MRLLVTIVLALGGAIVVSGCGGGAGPATPPFNPFGVDSPGSTTEAQGGSTNETPPPTGGQSLAQLCATACAEIGTACPMAAGTNCTSSCVNAPAMNPTCAAEFEAFLVCITTTPITCSSYGSSSIDAPACTALEETVASCLNAGTAAGAVSAGGSGT